MQLCLETATNANFQNLKELEEDLQASQSKTVKVRSAQNTSKIILSNGFKFDFCKTYSTEQAAGTKPCHLVLFGTIQRYMVLLSAIERYLALELLIIIF